MNKTVLITGATGDIGSAMAEAFAKDGYDVIVHTFSNTEKAKRFCEVLKGYGVKASYIKADFTKDEEIKALSEKALETGGIDVLINNAGIAYQELFQSVSEEKASEIFKINIESAVSLTKYIVPSMINNHKGVIINISSMWGVVGASCEVHYSTAKSAMTGFTRALAKEVGPSGIRVNCIAPGFIDTKMNSKFSKEDVEALKNDTPLMKTGKCEDVAELALFLASDKASFITGQIITVDGGLTL